MVPSQSHEAATPSEFVLRQARPMFLRCKECAPGLSAAVAWTLGSKCGVNLLKKTQEIN